MNLQPITVHIDDHSQEALAALENAIQRGAMAIGERAATYAKDNITRQGAVKTGNLRNKITYMVKDD